MSSEQLAFVTMLFGLTTAVFLVPFGRISDIAGRKKIFLLGVALFMIYCILSSMISQAWMFYPAVLLGGIGSAMCFSNVLSILSAHFPAEERGKILGMNVAAAYVGSSTGPLLGGFITHYFGWRGVFISLVPLILLCLAAGIKAIPHDETFKRQPFDIPGSLAWCASISLFIIGISSLGSSHGIPLLGAGIVALLVFLRLEKTRSHPLVDLGLFSNRVFSMSNLAALIHYGATYSVILMVSMYLQDPGIKAMDASMAGLVLLTQPALQVLCAPLAGSLSDRLPGRWLATGGMTLTMLGLLGLQFVRIDTSLEILVLILAGMGIGYAFFAAPNNNIVMSSVSSQDYGIASGMLATSRIMGMSISLAISTMILTFVAGTVAGGSSEGFMHGFTLCFQFFTVLSLFGIGASMARG